MAANTHVSYTKAVCCCLSEPVSWEEQSGTAGLLLLFKGAAEASHERALERRTQAKKRTPGNKQPKAHQELSAPPVP